MTYTEVIFDQAKQAFGDLTVKDSLNSAIVTVHKQFYIPEKKIILADQFTEKESLILESMTHKKGGLIL